MTTEPVPVPAHGVATEPLHEWTDADGAVCTVWTVEEFEITVCANELCAGCDKHIHERVGDPVFQKQQFVPDPEDENGFEVEVLHTYCETCGCMIIDATGAL